MFRPLQGAARIAVPQMQVFDKPIALSPCYRSLKIGTCHRGAARIAQNSFEQGVGAVVELLPSRNLQIDFVLHPRIELMA